MTMDETIEAALTEPYRNEIKRLRAKLQIAIEAIESIEGFDGHDDHLIEKTLEKIREGEK